MKLKIATLLVLGTLGCSAQAQTQESNVWSLRQCIDYAIEHNIDIQRAKNLTDQSTVDVNTAKWSRLPNVNGSASQNWSWGRGTSPKDNTIKDNINSSQLGFGAQTDIPIFTGFRLPNQYSLSKLNLKASIEDLNKAKEDLSINVASTYLQALLDLELRNIAQKQTEISKAQWNRLKELFNEGKASTAEVVEAEARVSQDEMNAVKAENAYKLSLLNLSQLLELPNPEKIELEAPVDEVVFTSLSPIDDIYLQSINNKPVVKAAQYRLSGSDKEIKIAQSGYYPELNLNVGLSTGYYSIDGIASEGFKTQLKSNLRKYVGLSLNIPIFNRFETRNKIRKAKLQKIGQALILDNTKKALYKEIQQAWYNALTAESKYNASLSSVEANQKSFQLISEKYANGKATSIEYNEAKFNLTKAQSEKVQSKYNYLFSSKIINFYKGIPIE